MSSPNRPHPVAPGVKDPGKKNPLPDGVRRLPLGWTTADPGDPRDHTGKPIQWRIWIPTVKGGILTISHDQDNTLKLTTPYGDALVSGKRTIAYEVSRGTCGEFRLESSPKPGKLTCQFTQTGWARESAEKGADPIIPWNFWYWKIDRSDKDADRAVKLMNRYRDATGKAFPSSDGSDSPGAWEHDHHQIDHDPHQDWGGHCNNVSPASALFEMPPEATKIGAESFTRSEMELLAGEFYGNRGKELEVWKLGEPNDPADRPIPTYFKPGRPKTSDALHHLRSVSKKDVEALIEGIRQKYGDEGESSRKLGELFGRMAVDFYAVLIAYMREGGAPLTGDLRLYEGGQDPVAVWNQISFYYRATYQETPENEDDRDMTISCDVYSNTDHRIDVPGASTKPPDLVDVTTSGVTDKVVGEGRPGVDYNVYKHQWRIVFTTAGEILASDPRCAWLHLQNHAGAELFPPRQLIDMHKPDTEGAPRASGDPAKDSFWRGEPAPAPKLTRDEFFVRGNPIVGEELLKYLKLRKRYR